MSARRFIACTGLAFCGAILCFTLGSYSAQHSMSLQIAENDARIAALRDEMARSILNIRQSQNGRASGTDGQREPEVVSASGIASAPLVEEIKRQLQSEMGLLPVRLLRERRESFVELNAYDNFGKSSYGTAGYLGNGYFITVKHGVVALDGQQDGREPRRINRITIRHKGKDLPARLIDSGDANVEVHPGDWAIIKVRGDVDLPALHLDPSYAFEFADPIFRLGNDYSKGIILSTGYVGQRTANGLVTCLTDGHPGVSGGGVLDQAGSLVGIPIGRMQGDYRFSFILPVRAEMFRKVPALAGLYASTTN
jgi:S1-C subfamily serine protease